MAAVDFSKARVETFIGVQPPFVRAGILLDTLHKIASNRTDPVAACCPPSLEPLEVLQEFSDEIDAWCSRYSVSIPQAYLEPLPSDGRAKSPPRRSRLLHGPNAWRFLSLFYTAYTLHTLRTIQPEVNRVQKELHKIDLMLSGGPVPQYWRDPPAWAYFEYSERGRLNLALGQGVAPLGEYFVARDGERWSAHQKLLSLCSHFYSVEPASGVLRVPVGLSAGLSPDAAAAQPPLYLADIDVVAWANHHTNATAGWER